MAFTRLAMVAFSHYVAQRFHVAARESFIELCERIATARGASIVEHLDVFDALRRFQPAN